MAKLSHAHLYIPLRCPHICQPASCGKCLTRSALPKMENANEMQPNIFPPRRLSYFYVFLLARLPCPSPRCCLSLLAFLKQRQRDPKKIIPPPLTHSLAPAGREAARRRVQPLLRHLRQTNKSSHLFAFVWEKGRGTAGGEGAGSVQKELGITREMRCV